MDQNLPSMLTLSLDEEANKNPPGAPLLSHQEENINDSFSPPQSSSRQKAADTSLTAQETSELNPAIKMTPTDSMKNSLINIMAPVVYEMDDRILAVKESQLQLQSLIKRLLEGEQPATPPSHTFL